MAAVHHIAFNGTKMGTLWWGRPVGASPLATYRGQTLATIRSWSPNTVGSIVSSTVTLTVNPDATAPSITALPLSQMVNAGANVTLSTMASGNGQLSYQWQQNGVNVPGLTSTLINISGMQPAYTGLFSVLVTSGTATSVGPPAIVGLKSTAKLVGPGTEFPNIFHAGTGFTYDQILLGGAAASVTADSALGQILRISFISLLDDIVQVEFSGPGTLSLVLAVPSGPALPINYNQATTYMKGHAGIVLSGASATTNLSAVCFQRWSCECRQPVTFPQRCNLFRPCRLRFHRHNEHGREIWRTSGRKCALLWRQRLYRHLGA